MATHIIKTTDFVEAEELTDEPAFKIAKTAIFYAAASLILAFVLVPWSNFSAQQMASAFSDDPVAAGIDRTVTGSVTKAKAKRTHIRRSVLQSDPSKPCFVLSNGKTEGNC